MVYESAGTEDESEEAVFGIELLDLVEESRDDVVTAGSLTAAKNDTDVHLLSVGLVAGNEFNHGHAVGVGEELLDFFLIVYTLCRFTFLDFHCALKSLRQLGLIGSSCYLQSTFFHN